MDQQQDVLNCTSCNQTGTGNYCSNCGRQYKTKRISLHSLLHETFHFFTHLDKGFGLTLKMLLAKPGFMQRNYVLGERANHQKPFSMFFICATISALTRYWILLALLKYYHSGNVTEAGFLHEHMVLMQILLVPVYVFITYLFFIKDQYNYAETGVMVLYTTSVFFLFGALIFLLKFIWPELDTAFVELPLFMIYNTMTLSNFYTSQRRWLIVLKSIVVFVGIFLINQLVESVVIKGSIELF